MLIALALARSCRSCTDLVLKFSSQIKFLLSAGFVALVVVTNVAHAQNTRTDYVPFVHNGTADFKTKFAPGVNSAFLLESQGVNTDETRIHNQKSNHSILKYKVFVPPGSRRITLTMGTYLSAQESKVSAALGKVPLLAVDQINAFEASKVDTNAVLNSLSMGNEVQFYSPPNAGFVVMSQPLIDPTLTFKTSGGEWVYVNVLSVPSNIIVDQFAGVHVDQRCYRSWYAKAIRENLFDSAGNPIEFLNGVPYTHTVEAADVAYCGGNPGPELTRIDLVGGPLVVGSSGTVRIVPTPSDASTLDCKLDYPVGVSNLANITQGYITLASGANQLAVSQEITVICGAAVSAKFTIAPAGDPLTGISLSKPALPSNDLTTFVTVSPIPATASLPSACQAYASDGVTRSPYATFFGNQFSLTAAAKENITLTNRVLVIKCGSDIAKTTFTIDVPLQITDRIANDGTLTLAFQFKPEAFAAPSKARIWVIGHAPKNALLGLLNDVYLYRTEAGIWDVLYQSFDFDRIAFMHIAELKDSQEMIIPTGVRKSDLALLGVEIHFFYQVEDGVMKYLGKVFPH